jgi:hypothetical protein
MRRKIVIVSVTAFWVVMMVLLAHRQARLTAEDELYREVTRGSFANETVRMDVYRADKRVGETRTTRSLLGTVSYNSLARLDSQCRLDHLHIRLKVNDQQLIAVGRAEGDELTLKVSGFGLAGETVTIPNANGLTLASGLLPLLPSKELRVGNEWDVPTFDLSSGTMARGRARVTDMETILWDDRMYKCYRIAFSNTLGRITHTAWSDRRGNVLVMEMGGVKLVRRPDED